METFYCFDQRREYDQSVGDELWGSTCENKSGGWAAAAVYADRNADRTDDGDARFQIKIIKIDEMMI